MRCCMIWELLALEFGLGPWFCSDHSIGLLAMAFYGDEDVSFFS